MPQSILIKPLNETWDFPDSATDEQIKDFVGREVGKLNAGFKKLAAEPPQLSSNPYERVSETKPQTSPEPVAKQPEFRLPSETPQPGLYPQGPTDVQSQIEEAQNIFSSGGRTLTKLGNIARAVPADVAVSLSQNINTAPNLRAALTGRPMPIDAQLEEAAKESPAAATLGQVSQGVAASAPLLALGGLPGWAGRLVAGGFSADMILHAPKQFQDYAEEINKPESEQDQNKIAQLRAGIIQTFAFSPVAGAHALRMKPSALNPRFDWVEGFAKSQQEQSKFNQIQQDIQPKPAEVINLEQAGAPATAAVVQEIVQPKPEERFDNTGGTRVGSWVVVDKSTGKAVLETYSQSVADKVNKSKFEVLTALEYLQSLNKPKEANAILEKGPEILRDVPQPPGKVEQEMPAQVSSEKAAETRGKEITEDDLTRSELQQYQQNISRHKLSPEQALAEILKGREEEAAWDALPQSERDRIVREEWSVKNPEKAKAVLSPPPADLKEQTFHKLKVENAVLYENPVNAKAVEKYSIKLPDGYVQEGELFVFKPKPESPVPSPEIQGQTQAPSLSKQATREPVPESALSGVEGTKPETISQPSVTPGVTEVKRQRLKELTGQIKALADKEGLTTTEAEQFRKLNSEANDIRFEIAKPLPLEKIPPPAERKSTLPSEIVLTARNDLARNKNVYDPIIESAIGVYHGADTPVDLVMAGKNPNLSAAQLYDAFSDTRNALREHYGDKITLYRAVGKQKDKPTTNWATTKEYAEQFGKSVIIKEIPVDDIIAVNVGLGGKYHEVIVGAPPIEAKPIGMGGAVPAETKVRVGKSPQPFTILEKLPQSETEKANNEQPIKVRNDKTGQEQVVMESDTQPITVSEQPKSKSKRDINAELRDAGLDPSVFPNKASKQAALDRAKAMETQGAIATATPPLAPSAPSPATPVSVKSQRQMITDISKAIGIPIRFGRLTTNKYAGYYKKIADLIGVKKASDLPTSAHEAGHKLDDMFGLSGDATIRTELDRLGDPATPGSASSWTASKPLTYKYGEGVAEFVRYWLTDPAKARTEAPNTFTAFETILDNNKDLGDAMRQVQEDVHVWKTAPEQSRLRAQISVGDNPNKTRYSLSQLTRDVVDDLHILRKATSEAKEHAALEPSQDPYLLARNLRGSYGMADTFVRNGIIDFKTKEVLPDSSLEAALKPVAGRLNDFRDWIVAKRAQELHGQGKETGVLPGDANAVAAKFDADTVFQAAFQKIKAWQNGLLKYAEDAGLINAESARAMRDLHQDYVPFHRVFEVGAGEPASQQSQGIGMGLQVGKPGSLKQLVGSGRQIVDPLETMVKNAYTLITASEKAAINKAVADLSQVQGMGKWVERVATPKQQVKFELERIKKALEAAGADLSRVPDDLLLSFFRSSERAPFGENIIKVVKNGEPEFYRLDKHLHDTFQALDLEDSSNLVRILSQPAQLLRAGVTLEPGFSLANAMRDTFDAAIISKHGLLPFESTLRGFAAMLGGEKGKKLISEWAASGGKSSVESAFFDRKKMQAFLAHKISKDMTPAERATIIIKSPLTALRLISSAFEEATRIGEYQKTFNDLTSKGMNAGEARRLAAFEARDRQDFAKGGAKMKIVRHMAPFWNAALQGNIRLMQAFKERPFITAAKGLAFITSVKMAEQMLNWDDKDYWDRPQWERDIFFMIPRGKDDSGHTTFIRLPIPFLAGVIFATLPGRVMQYAHEHDPEALKTMWKPLAKEALPNLPSHPLVTSIYENFLTGPRGWDLFRNRQVVPERLVDLPPEQQFTEQTTALAKKAGETIGVSPIKIDHFIEQNLGGLGKVLSGKQVPGQRFTTVDLNVSNEPEQQFYRQLEELRQKKAGKIATQPEISKLRTLERFADTVSRHRKAERNAKTDADKQMNREKIFQAEKQALEAIKEK